MTFFSQVSQHPVVLFIGWILAHSVWIGALFGSLTWFCLATSLRLSSSLRHHLCFLCLLIPSAVVSPTALSAEPETRIDECVGSVPPTESGDFLEPISGIILGPAGRPLPNVRVYLRSRPFSHRPEIKLGETVTDSDGNFAFQGVEKPVFKDPSRTLYPLDVIAVKARHSIRWKKLLNAEHNIQLQLKKESLFRGLLRDDAGNPIKDATIRVQNLMSLNTISKIDIPGGHFPSTSGDSYLDVSQPHVGITATTDAKGKFVIGGLPNRVGMTLLVDDLRYVNKKIYAATTRDDLPKIPIAVSTERLQKGANDPDAVRRILNPKREYTYATIHGDSSSIAISRGVHLTVNVVDDETGKPIANAAVNGIHGTSHLNHDKVQTDSNGNIDFYQCRPGLFWVYASAPKGRPLIGARQLMDLSKGGFDLEKEMRLKRGVFVSGRVIDTAGEGVEGAQLLYRPDKSFYQAGAEYAFDVKLENTDSEGRFQFVTPAVKGKVTVSRVPAPYTFSNHEKTEKANSRYFATVFPTFEKPIVGLEFTVEKTSPIPFRFVSENNEPITISANARYFFTSNSYREIAIQTDETGLIDLAETMPNDRTVSALQLMIRSSDKLRAAFYRTKEIESLKDNTTTITLHPVASVKGRVADQDTGRPIERAVVWLSVSFGNGRGQGVEQFATNGRGEFGFFDLVPNLNYSLGFHATDYVSLNSIKTQFKTNPSAEHHINVELIPKKPKKLGDLKPVQVPSVGGLAPEKAVDLLIDEYNIANQEYRAMVRKGEYRELVNQIVQLREPTQFYAPTIMKLANEHQGTEVELRCLIWLSKAGLVAGTADKYRHLKTEAADRIMENYWDSKELQGAESNIIYASKNRYQSALKLTESPFREIRGQAFLTAAEIVEQKYQDRYRGQLDSLRDRAIELYEIVIENYADLPHWRFGTIGKKAEINLFALKFIGFGKVAPEMKGVDLNGKPIRLSDFRGEVVAIHYWEGSLSNFRRLNRFADEYRGKPFVIIGVNTDQDREQAILAAKESNADGFRHFNDPAHEIHAKWSGSWPTTHVIGHDGKILYLGDRRSGGSLEDMIDTALNSMDKHESDQKR